MEYTSISRVLAQTYRNLKGSEELRESDIIEWAGEALSFLRVYETYTQAVYFSEVKDYHCDIPFGFVSALQIAKNTCFTKETCCPKEAVEEAPGENLFPCLDNEANNAGYPVPLDCNGRPLTDQDLSYYRPYYDLQWEYSGWTQSNLYTQKYVPVRLADHTLFNSIVCKEKNRVYNNVAMDEYTIVGDMEKKLRFSFKDGFIAMAYLKTPLDEEGYPLVPDEPNTLQAVQYYVKWKIAEWNQFAGRKGYDQIVKDSFNLWQKYCRQSKNYMKMPKTIDDYQDLLEQSHYLIPNYRRYYGFFGNLNREEDRGFNNPENNRRYGYYGR